MMPVKFVMAMGRAVLVVMESQIAVESLIGVAFATVMENRAFPKDAMEFPTV
jgi:hypothetical protein